MLRLNVQVPQGRDRTSIATLRDGLKIVATGHAVASTTPAIAAARANPECDPLRLCGHPPLGSYTLAHHRPAQPGELTEYGAHLLLFEPDSGAALDAESFGRLGLLVYGGPPGHDMNMRRTQGGLRLSDDMLLEVVSRVKTGEDMKLDLIALSPRRWWQFWKPEIATRRLSTTEPTAFPAPLDELSLLEMLLREAPRRDRKAGSDSWDDAFDRDRSDRSSSGTTSTGAEAFEGKGGTGGGAGASGNWSDGASASRGVDSAGRILGAAAAIGAVGALAAMTREAAAVNQLDAESGVADPAGAVSSESTSGDTSTSTSY